MSTIDFLSGGGEEEKKQTKREEKPEVRMTKPVAEKKSGWLGSIFKKKPKVPVKPPEKKPSQDVLAKSVLPKESKPEPKPAPKPEPKPAPKPEVKPAPKPEVKEQAPPPTTGGLGISLIPKKTVVIPRIVRSRYLLFFAALAVILAVFILIWLYADWHFEQIETEVERIERQMQFSQARSASLLGVRDEITALEAKAARTENILNNHIYWTKFFSLLETHTIPDIYYNDFSAGTSGTITLDVLAQDLISVARQIIVFTKATDFVKELDVSGIAMSPIGITASFNLVLVDDIFHK